MIWNIDILLLTLLIILAVFGLTVKDLLSAAIIFSAYSLVMAIIWVEMNAVDVAFTEAAVGAGVSTVLLILTISKTTRRSKD